MLYPLALLISASEKLVLSAPLTGDCEEVLGVAPASLLGFVAVVSHGLHSLVLGMVRACIAPDDLAPPWFLLSAILIKS